MRNRLYLVIFSGENVAILKEIMKKREEIKIICARK